MLDGRAAALAAIRTIEMTYRYDEEADDRYSVGRRGGPPAAAADGPADPVSTSMSFQFAKSGSRYFEAMQAAHGPPDNPRRPSFDRTVAFDGQTSATRQSGAGKVLLMSEQPQPRSQPEPATKMAGSSLDDLEWYRSNGYFHIRAAAREVLDGKPVVRVEFGSRTSADQRLVVWVSTGEGFLIVRTTNTFFEGGRRQTGTVQEVAAVPGADGATAYVPVRGVCQYLHDGVPYRTIKVAVDRESIRVNHPIDDARFVVQPEPGERVGWVGRPVPAPGVAVPRPVPATRPAESDGL